MPREKRCLNWVPLFPNELRLEGPDAWRLERGCVHPQGHALLEGNWVARVNIFNILEQFADHIEEKRLPSIRLGVLWENEIADFLQHRFRERALFGARSCRGQKTQGLGAKPYA